LYVAVKGDVFDVSEARSFYGPGGGYALFAGRDASKCLATMSLEEVDLDQPIDGLNHGEREHLDEWHFKFKELKGYPILGRLATPPSTKVISRAELLERGTGTCAPSPGRCCAEHLIGVRGNVYDVGFGGVGFYGAGCSYHLFCGKDASRALAKMSFKPEDVDRGWPDLGDLDEKEVKILDDWEKLFARKYPVVARLREADE
jgi:membrane-associated progesterone receptor component